MNRVSTWCDTDSQNDLTTRCALERICRHGRGSQNHEPFEGMKTFPSHSKWEILPAGELWRHFSQRNGPLQTRLQLRTTMTYEDYDFGARLKEELAGLSSRRGRCPVLAKC